MVRISDDRMKALVNLHPSPGGKAPLTLAAVLTLLKEKGVTTGIDRPGLEAKIQKVNTTGKALESVAAARGTPPVNAEPPSWEFKKNLLAPPVLKERGSRVEYREASSYILVKKGSPLAKRNPGREGQPGINVLGKTLPPAKKESVSYQFGDNLKEKDQILYALASGRFEMRGNVVSINETLEIDGNVDYSTGHIVFPGDVVIRGEIRDGFRVEAGGSIFLQGTMDATQVMSRKDLHVGGGIKGRQKALVRVKGAITAKFIENCTVEAHKGLYVAKSVVHSHLFTLGAVKLGDHSVLVGGETWAETGITAWNIGRADGPETIVKVGTDYEMDRKFRLIEAQKTRLDKKCKALRARQPTEKTIELIGRVEEAMAKMDSSKEKFRKHLISKPDAAVIIKGTIYPGTEIFLAGHSYRVVKEQSNIRFYYEPSTSKIVIKSL